jgi:hypothetical protein
MKARDLAALAALGIAGKYAYDKFGGKKDDEPKTRGELGKSQSANDGDAGESEARMSKRDMNEGSGRRDAGGNAKRSRQENDVPEALSRQERDVLNSVSSGGGGMRPEDVGQGGSQAAASAAYKKLKAAAASGSSESKGKSSSAAQAPVADYSNEGRSSKASAASDTGPTFSSSEEGMKRYVPRRPGQAAAPAPTFSSSEAGMKSYVPRRTGQTPSAVQQTSRPAAPQSMARYPGGLAKRGANVSVPEDKPITRPLGTDQDYLDAMMATAPVGPLAKLAAKAAYTKDKPLNYSTQPALGNSNTPLLGAPAKQLTGPSKADLMARDRASRSASREDTMLRENAERYGLNPNAPGYDATASSLRNQIGGRDFTLRKKGGVVRMASGGMTSSKMSKPSGASRGDGIAQRGRTRGTLR